MQMIFKYIMYCILYKRILYFIVLVHTKSMPIGNALIASAIKSSIKSSIHCEGGHTFNFNFLMLQCQFFGHRKGTENPFTLTYFFWSFQQIGLVSIGQNHWITSFFKFRHSKSQPFDKLLCNYHK